MELERLLAKLRALAEQSLRVRALAEAIAEGEPATWVATIAQLLVRARGSQDPHVLAAAAALVQALVDERLSYPRKQVMYETAMTGNLIEVARLFFTWVPGGPMPRGILEPERALTPRGRILTLGERKALARTSDRAQLALITRDPHPDVIAILLSNPHLVEVDVVRIAAARGIAAPSLALIAQHPRWSVRLMVKRALLFNVHTPLIVAVRIAATLRQAELRAFAQEGSVPEPLQSHLVQILGADGSPARVAVP